MVPVSSRSSTSSRDEAGLRTDLRVATLAAKELVCPPARAPKPLAFELRCADAHLVGCAEVLRAVRAGDVVALARVHGFTPVWCGPAAWAHGRCGDVAGWGTR